LPVHCIATNWDLEQSRHTCQHAAELAFIDTSRFLS
jgi:hypothetical protein